MNARLGLLIALIFGAVAKAAAAPANTQARTAVDTPRVYDGAHVRADAAPVFAGDPSKRPATALTPEQLALEEQRLAAARNSAALRTGLPTPEPAPPAKEPLTAWNPLLNGAKGALLMAIVGFTLGGPLGLMVGAAVGGAVAWGMSKVG
jgi:hypothetical protein